MSLSDWRREMMARLRRGARRAKQRTPATRPLHAEELERRDTPTIYLSGDVTYTQSVTFNEPVVVTGNTTLRIDPSFASAGDITFGPLARVTGDGVGGPDSLTINTEPPAFQVPGPVVVLPPVFGGPPVTPPQTARGSVTFQTPSTLGATTVGGGGLTNFTVWAGPALVVADGVKIDIAGALRLSTDQGVTQSWTAITPIFRYQVANTTLTIGAATLKAANVDITARATTAKFADLVVDEIRLPDTPLDLVNTKTAVAGTPAGLSFTFVDAEDATALDRITRNTGSWTTDGFLAGHVVAVTGTLGNDGYYVIDSVTDTDLVLSQDAELNGGGTFASGVTVRQEVLDASQVPLLAIDASVGLAAGTVLVFTAPGTVTRLTGRWDTAVGGDGFNVGDVIAVEDSAGNDGVYVIDAVSADGTVLTISSGRAGDPIALDVPAVTGAPVLQFVDNGADADAVTRAAGNWTDDGFAAGMLVAFAGVGANAGTYRIAAVSADGLTLTLDDDAAATPGSFTGVTVVVHQEGVSVRKTIVSDPAHPLTSQQVEENLMGVVEPLFRLVDLLPIGPRALVAETTSTLAVNAGASITAFDGNVRIAADAAGFAELDLPAIWLGFTYVKSAAAATAIVTGATITATGRFDLTADVRHIMTSTVKAMSGFAKEYSVALGAASGNAKKPILIPGPALGAAYGEARSTSAATLGAGSVVEAAAADVSADNLNTFTTQTTSKVNGIKKPNTGAAAAAAVSQTDSTATTLVAGTVRTTGGRHDVRLIGNPELVFDALTYSPDTITRAEGNWAADGFTPGMPITIAHSYFNNGRYVIAAISPNGRTLTLTPDAELVQEYTSRELLRNVFLPPIEVRADELTVHARSVNTRNDTIGIAAVKPVPTFVTAAESSPQWFSQPNTTKTQGFRSQLSDPGKFVAAAAFALADSTNTANVTIAPGGRLSAEGDLAVTSYAEDNYKAVAASDAKAQYDKKKPAEGNGADTGFAGAVAVSTYSNTATTTISSGAALAAARLTEIDSRAVVPNQLRLLDDIYAVINFDLDLLPIDNTDALSQANSGYNTAADVARQVAVPLQVVIEDAIKYKKTAALKLTNTYTHAEAAGNKLGMSGSVNLHRVTNTAATTLVPGASVNNPAAADPLWSNPAAAPEQDVRVTSRATLQVVNYAGLGALFPGSPAKGASGKEAAGATYQGLEYTVGATTTVGDGAVVLAGRDVTIDSTTRHFYLDITQSGGDGDRTALSGGVLYHDVHNTTLTTVDDGARVVAGRDAGVTADHVLLAFNIGGNVTKGGRAVGLGGVATTITSHVTAAVGDTTLENGREPRPGGLQGVFARRDATVAADTRAVVATVGIAAGVSDGGTDPDEIPDGVIQPDLFNKAPATEAYTVTRGGVGVAGSVVVNLFRDTTLAKVGPGGVLAADTDQDGTGTARVGATHDGVVVALAGAAAIAKEGTSNTTAAIAGAVTVNELTRDVRAVVDGGRVSGADVVVAAHTDEKTASATFGGAGTKKSTYPSGQKSGAIAGSGNVNFLTSTTIAAVETGSFVTATDDVTIDAQETRILVTAAGAGAVSGTAGVGAAMDINFVTNTVRASTAGVVTAGGDVGILAAADTTDVSVAASLAVGTKGMGLSGSATSVNFTTDVRATVAPSASVDAAGSVVVDAADDVFTVQVGGSIGAGMGGQGQGSASGVGVGAAVTHAFLDRHVVASVGDHAVVNARGRSGSVADPAGELRGYGLIIDATARDERYQIGLAGAGGDKLAVAASVVLTLSDSTVQALVGADAQINQSNNAASSVAQGVTVRAAHTSDVIAVAGGVAVAAGSKSLAGVGAAADGQDLTSTVQALVGPGADVTVKGDFVVVTNSDLTQYDVAVAVGGAAKNFAGAASAAVVVLDATSEAALGSNVTVTAGGNVVVRADSAFRETAAAGAAAIGFGSGTSAFGVSAAVVSRTQDTLARIDSSAVVNAAANGAAAVGPDGVSVTGVLVSADATDQLLLLGLGAAGADNLAIAGSAAADDATVTVRAAVGDNALVNQAAGATAAQSAAVRSDYTSDVDLAAGAVAVAKSAGIGAAAGVALADRTVEATIGAGARVAARDDVAVTATFHESFLGVAVGVGASAKVGIAGSAVVHKEDNTTRAAVGANAVVAAGDLVNVAADGTSTVSLVAGAVGVGVNAVGFGASNTTLVRDDTVEATVGAGARVDGAGAGVTVGATSTETVLGETIGGGVGGRVGIAASATVNLLTETTRATVGANAHINQATTGAAVTVLASDTTTLTGLAGQVAGGGNAGIGAGADAGVVTKVTEAALDAGSRVSATGDVVVSAASRETIVSVSAQIAVAGNVAVAGGAAVSDLDITTRARVGSNDAGAAGATVRAGGTLLVAADDQTTADVAAGNITGAGTVAVGGSAAVALSTKTTEAYIGRNSVVEAKGGGAGVQATVGFDVGVVSDLFNPATAINQSAITLDHPHGFQTGDVVFYRTNGGTPLGGLTDGGTYYAIRVDDNRFKLAATPEDAEAGTHIVLIRNQATGTRHGVQPQGQVTAPPPKSDLIDLNADGVGDVALDSQATGTRTAAARTQLVRGVAVTAVSSDDVAVIGISAGGAGTVAVNISAGAVVADVTTSAFVGDDARVNQDTTGEDARQAVVISAATDYGLLDVAGAGSIGGSVAVTPGVGVAVVDLTTTAAIGALARVAAQADVQVTATTNADVLMVSAALAGSGGVGVGGSAAALKLTDVTSAAVGASAAVFANGNVLVRAADTTDADVIAGALAVGANAGIGAGVGVTLIDKDTRATIGASARVDGLANSTGLMTAYTGDGNLATETIKGVAVQAVSSEDVLAVAVAGGISGSVGFAGSVTVAVIDSDTTAEVGAGAQVNQAAGAGVGQDVDVAAVNRLKTLTVDGAVGAGGVAGIAGGVDVGLIRNDTAARVGAGAVVTARRDVDVQALATKDIKSYAVSVGAAVNGVGVSVGLAASVTVLTVGGNLGSSYSHDKNGDGAIGAGETDDLLVSDSDPGSTAGGFADTATDSGGMTALLSDYATAPQSDEDENSARLGGVFHRAGGALTLHHGGGAAGLAAVGPRNGTSAVVDTGAQVTAGRDIELDARDTLTVSTIAGSLGVGGSLLGVGVGASVALVTNNGNTEALVAPEAVLRAATVTSTGDVSVDARTTTDVSSLGVAGGAGGLFGLAAAVSVVTDNTATRAAVLDRVGNKPGAQVRQADEVVVHAESDVTLGVASLQGAFALGGAVGAAVTRAAAGGSTTATLGTGATVSGVRAVTVEADAAATVGSPKVAGGAYDIEFMAVGISAAALAGAGADARAAVTTDSTASLGDNVTVAATDDVRVASQLAGTAAANVNATSGGVLAVGAAYSDATVSGSSRARVGTGGSVTARDIAVRSATDADANAKATAAGGGLAAGTGNKVTATVTTDAGQPAGAAVAGGTLHAGRDILVESAFLADADATGQGVTVGVGASIGVSLATATVTPDVETTLAAGTVAAGGDVTVRTLFNTDAAGNHSAGDAHADANASGGGILSGNGVDVTATNSADTRTTLGAAGATVTAGGLVLVVTRSNLDASAEAGAFGGGVVSIGAALADSFAGGTESGTGFARGTTAAQLADGTTLAADGVLLTSQADYRAVTVVEASGGGLFSGNGSDGRAFGVPGVSAVLGAATVTAADFVDVAALATGTADTTAKGINGGGLTVGASIARAEASPLVAATAGGGGKTIKARELWVTADTAVPEGTDHAATASATGATGALIGVSATESNAVNNGQVGVALGDRTVLSVTDSVAVAATNRTNQYASADSITAGLIAAGSNVAHATTNTVTTATVGAGTVVGAGSPVGGLADGAIYYAVVDVNDPTRVSLADSFRHATAEQPVVIDLTAPAVSGAGHRLTPNVVLSGSPTGATFDPEAALNAAGDFLTLPAGHGLYTGQAVVYRKGAGPVMSVTASGDDRTLAYSEAGSGGVVAGAGAVARTTTTSTTAATVADSGSGPRTDLEVARLVVGAEHVNRFDSQTSTIQASALGFSGSWARNTATSDVRAAVGSARIHTGDLVVDAVNTSRKNLLDAGDYNVKAGSGGVLQGNAAESTTTIAHTTVAELGDRADVAAVAGPGGAGGVRVTAFNDIEGSDDVRLDTGGVIVGSGVTSKVTADAVAATARLGDRAKVRADGDVTLATSTRAVLTLEPQVHTYGLAAAGIMDGLARVGATDAVQVGANADVEALGQLRLFAGRGADGTANDFRLSVTGDSLNASLVPIDVPHAETTLTQTNTVDVAAGAWLRGARDAELVAERFGNAVLTANYTTKNWVTAAAGGIDSLTGANGVSEGATGGTATHTPYTAVTVAGTVEVGIRKDVALTIDKDYVTSRALSAQSPGVTVAFTEESVASNLDQERDYWLTLVAEYAGDASKVAAYQAEVTRVEDAMRALGLSSFETPEAGGPATELFLTEYTAPYLTVGNIFAASGTIRVFSDNLLGAGTLKAPSDVSVAITNHSPAYLRVSDVTVLNDLGGQVRFNGQSVTSAAAVGAINATPGTPGLVVSAGSGSGNPRITIVNDFDADAAVNLTDAFYSQFRTSPDVELIGNIADVPAELTIVSTGSVVSRGNVSVGTLSITTGLNFVQSYTDTLVNAGGSPTTLWAEVTALTEARKVGGRWSAYFTTPVDAIRHAVDRATTARATGSIVAANNVFISARYLNVNGVIQSGRAARTATVEADRANAITAADEVYALARAGQTGAARVLAATYGLDTADLTYFKMSSAASTDAVYYNAELGRLELDRVSVAGGVMNLFGQVISTGGGDLRVLDGYGRVTVNNYTATPLVVNDIDTGADVRGRLVVTDIGKAPTAGPLAGRPLVTAYWRDRATGTVHSESHYLTQPGEPAAVVVAAHDTGAARTGTYTPAAGQRFVWTTGQQSTTRTVTTYATSKWLGIDNAAKDPSNIVAGPYTEFLTDRPLLEGSYVESDDLSLADYIYRYNSYNLSATSQTESWVKKKWYGTKTYYDKVTVVSGDKEVHTHSIRANYPVAVTFLGADAGAAGTAVSIYSAGDVLLNGRVRNGGGDTTIYSGGGRVTQLGDAAVVGGRSVIFGAATGIGAGKAVRTDLVDGVGGGLGAITVSGPVAVEEIAGPLRVTTVVAGGDVTLTAAQDITAPSGSTPIIGAAVTLVSKFGSVGSLGTGGTARTPGAGAAAVRVNTGTAARDTLTVRAQGDVNVTETSGDLRVVAVTTTGGARVTAPTGALLDANSNESRDARTEEQLRAVWDRLNATAGTARESIDATVAAYESQKTREYQTYWHYRNTQRTPAVYDPAFTVRLTTAEVAYYTAYYTAQGVNAAAAITTLEAQRTTEYRTLHQTFGKFGNAYDPGYRYRANRTPLAGQPGSPFVAQSFGAGEVSGSAVLLTRHAYTTGQPVVYHASGGGVAGLTDGKTYYVVVDAADPARVRLAATYAAATAAVPVTILLGAVDRGGQYLSEVDVLAERAVWSDSQLRNTVGVGVLRPRW